jgi:pyruvate dehydrogenase (quinone)
MPTVAETIVTALAELGVTQIWGVVGDALNPVTDAIRREERLEWIGVRHEEAGAFAASAQAQLTGRLGVCMGTVGPGSLHLLNGLYDAKKSRAPVLAVCGQVPLADIGSDFFQEVDNDAVFSDVATFCRTLTSPEQLPRMLEQAVQSAIDRPGVAVLTMPGDVGGLDFSGTAPHFVTDRRPVVPDREALRDVASRIDGAGAVTLLAGLGVRHARTEILALADRLAAPMVLTLKAK